MYSSVRALLTVYFIQNTRVTKKNCLFKKNCKLLPFHCTPCRLTQNPEVFNTKLATTARRCTTFLKVVSSPNVLYLHAMEMSSLSTGEQLAY
jgi:hypothetical protein